MTNSLVWEKQSGQVQILGVRVDSVTLEKAVDKVGEMMESGGQCQIVTPNPEHIVLAQKDEKFKQILNRARLSVPDGAGLVWASRVLAFVEGSAMSQSLQVRVTGTDLMERLCQEAARRDWSIFLLGAAPGVAAQAAGCLQQRYPGLKIAGTSSVDPEEASGTKIFTLRNSAPVGRDHSGHSRSLRSSPAPLTASNSPRDENFVPSPPSPALSLEPLTPRIDLLFVAYGAPTQEKWIAQNLSHLPVKVAMGVGGAFDFIAGRQKRAPRFLRRHNLEWLWRLITQPWRIRRQFALVKFVLKVLKYAYVTRSYQPQSPQKVHSRSG